MGCGERALAVALDTSGGVQRMASLQLRGSTDPGPAGAVGGLARALRQGGGVIPGADLSGERAGSSMPVRGESCSVFTGLPQTDGDASLRLREGGGLAQTSSAEGGSGGWITAADSHTPQRLL